MAYKILYKGVGTNRRENWNNKTYTTKAGAKKQITNSIQKFKGNKYVKVTPNQFKIVKVQEKNAFGFPRMPTFRF